jgi:hypothetical protein
MGTGTAFNKNKMSKVFAGIVAGVAYWMMSGDEQPKIEELAPAQPDPKREVEEEDESSSSESSDDESSEDEEEDVEPEKTDE